MHSPAGSSGVVHFVPSSHSGFLQYAVDDKME